MAIAIPECCKINLHLSRPGHWRNDDRRRTFTLSLYPARGGVANDPKITQNLTCFIIHYRLIAESSNRGRWEREFSPKEGWVVDGRSVVNRKRIACGNEDASDPVIGRVIIPIDHL